ncbi:MAG: ABC transporter ATP-binding protein [Lachnospiraceae bacterium]|nr:ABC transporter ATP-binding protein [Lachnospiraceae bacterium]
MISFENVSKFILKDVSIHIPSGITVGVIGATGAGKTSFIKLTCGLLKPDSGKVHTMGKEPVSELGKAGNSMGVLFAHLPVLQAEESVISNFENLKLIYGLVDEEFGSEYEKLSEALGYGQFEHQKVRSLSLGQRRRVELGAVLIHKPKLLLLDEPTIGLDQNAKDIFREIIKDRETEGLTTIITSHDMSDISETCDRICILDNGRICYYGNRELLLKRYAPVDVMRLTLQGKLPDIEDLPVKKYSINGDKLELIYNSNHITSAEILKVILAKCPIKEVSISKPDLADVIMKIERGIADEQFYRSEECQ